MSDYIEANVGMFGLGNVGSWVVEYLNELYNPDKTGVKINLEKIVVRDKGKKRRVDIDSNKISEDRSDILNNPNVDVVVELIGGLHPAKEIILGALENGKDVITANKAVLAKYGDEIFSVAKKYRRNIGYQASVCGEMRVLEHISSIPSYKDISAVVGILNGTSNYVLTRMSEGQSYEDALTTARKNGFAESDESLDIEGIDAAQKLAILALTAFGVPVDYEKIYKQGISKITQADIKLAKQFECVIKPLAIVRRREKGLELMVQPTLISDSDPLAFVTEENNGVSIYLASRETPQTIIGKGAGKPTARSVVTDLVEVAKKREHNTVDLPPIPSEKIKIMKPEDVETAFYLRFNVDDKPGVLADIATILGKKYGINIYDDKQLHPRKVGVDSVVPLSFITYPTNVGHVHDSMKDIEMLPTVKNGIKMIYFK